MIQPILLHSLVIEPGTVTCLPFRATDHAELSAAATCHMIATFFQFDGRRAVEAPLPALFLGDLGEPRCSFIFGTFTCRVPAPVAGATDFRSAPTALTILATSVDTA